MGRNIDYLNKPEFCRYMAETKGQTIKAAQEATEDVFNCLRELLIDHKSVNIKHFGKFTTALTEPKRAWDFRKRIVDSYEPYWKTTFSQSKIFKEEVRAGEKRTI